jgi:molybdenum cofactor biosynthesis protein B
MGLTIPRLGRGRPGRLPGAGRRANILAVSTAAVITISDSRSAGLAEDTSGPAAAEELRRMGLDIRRQLLVPDEPGQIAQAVRSLIGQVGIVVTTGGTGIGPRDVTPEAIRPLLTRELPGFGEIMRTGSFARTPLSIISRGGAGVADRTLVIMLPGSPRGVRESLSLLGPAIQHVLKVLAEGRLDCQKETAV